MNHTGWLVFFKQNVHRAISSSSFVLVLFLVFPSSMPSPHIQLVHLSSRAHPAARQLQVGVWNGTQQGDAYIIKWTHVQMKLLSQPIKVNYQRQNAAVRKREGPARKLHCINEQHHFWKWRGNTELHLSAQDRARGIEGRERDGTQHWLPNYAFYHFSHNRVPPFFSCPVYSCSCSSAALMRKIKNNHNRVTFTSTDHQITSCCSITHTHKHM